MVISISTTNFTALMVQRHLSLTQLRMAQSMERLASGLRINRASDDAAGLVISERMRAQIRGAQQGITNAQFGVSMIQTADGALGEVNSLLLRMRDLAVEAGSNTLSTEARDAIGDELVALRDEIDNIAGRTTFNGFSLLTGAYNISTTSTIAPISDGGDDDTVTVDLNVRVADANTTYNVTVVGNDVTLTNAANGESQTITMTDLTGDGSTQTLSFDLLGVDVNLTLNQGATGDGTVSAADIAAGLDGSSVVTTGDTATSTLRVGDQPGDDISVSFDGQILARTLGSGPTENLADLIRDNQAVATVGEADTLLDSIDAAIGQVSAERARLGGSENQLGYAINSQSSRVFNLTAAESRIRDVDFAAETTRLSSLQIQQQALIALLVQANTMSKSVLSLIG